MDTSGIQLQNASDFGLIDFMDEANFEHFIDLIRGENAESIGKFCQNYDFEHISGCLPADNQFVAPTSELFNFEFSNQNSVLNSFPEEDNIREPDHEEEGDDESSGTTTTTTNNTSSSKRKAKVDRSRTLISERRRRGRMKEKLYALRSLVPNITKMDKASIVGDAVLYVQELQMQAKKLKTEIASLESSLAAKEKYPGGINRNARKMNVTNFYPVIRKIVKIEVFQVEDKGYYVRLQCNKGHGVAVSLFKALESLSSFYVQSSNLSTSADNYIMTFTLQVKQREVDINLPNFKLWIASAFLNQGFDFVTPLSA